MKLSPVQITKLVEKVFETWKAHQMITFKETEARALDRAVLSVKEDYQAEAELDNDVNKMLDQLERSNPGEFQRYKMFPMLKQKLAKERKVIL